MKTCGKCKEELPLSAFNKNRARPDGLHRDCRPCKKQYQAEWYQRHKDEHKERTRKRALEWHTENRRLIDSAKSIPCTDCGVKYPSYVMDLDHLPGVEKVGNLAQMARDFPPHIVAAEIAKCEVVCANCHRIRTFSLRS